MKVNYCSHCSKLLTFLLITTFSESLVKIQKYQRKLLPAWTPNRVIAAESSQLSCLSLCESDELACNVVEFDKMSLECKIGWIDSIDIDPSLTNHYGFFRMSSFMVKIIFKVVNAADNSLLMGVNISPQRADGEQFPTQVTNSDGEATLNILRYGSLSIIAEKPGFTVESANRILTNLPVQEIVIVMSALLQPGQFRTVLTWTCCVEDMDIFTFSSKDLDCWVDFGSTICFRGTSGSISFETDTANFGLDGGETIEWKGNFPSPDPYMILARNYFWETEISTAGVVVSMFSGNEPSIKVVAPSEPLTNTSLWLVGCFDPNLGLASFQEINVYTNDLFDYTLCSIS